MAPLLGRAAASAHEAGPFAPAAAQQAEGLVADAREQLRHPAGLERLLGIDQVVAMVRRALNQVDPRLVNHGLRVATLFDAMLAESGRFGDETRRCLYLTALLHDIGAYRTEEIDRMVEFETTDVWEHAFYGYLFFKELSPLADFAEVVLYHHMPNDQFADQHPDVRFLSQCLHVADRVDVLLMERPESGLDEVRACLESQREGLLDPRAVELFCRAERTTGVLGTLRPDAAPPDALRPDAPRLQPPASLFAVPPRLNAAECLDMLVHVIDFRSRHTVTHTVTTAWVAHELARLLLGERAAVRVYCAALLHDLGKIGIPLSILEKPGKLDAEEMAVMRTHVLLSESILDGLVEHDIFNAAVRHHEKLDGTGHPHGLAARDLAEADRIVAVADIVSALVGTRSYKEAYGKETVLRILHEQGGQGLVDPGVAACMEQHYDAILDVVAQRSQPVAAAYRRVQEEFAWLMGELEASRCG